MTRQADDADIVAEILAAELRTDPHLTGQLQNRLFHFEIAERLAVFVAVCGQIVEITRAGELDRFQVELGRGAADDDRKMIGRAGGCAERADFLIQKRDHLVFVHDSGCLLKQEGLVGRSAALGDEQEFVGIAPG